MEGIGKSANIGSSMLKTSGFTESFAQPATNSEPYYVNIAGEDIIGSNIVRRAEMCRKSHFKRHRSRRPASANRARHRGIQEGKVRPIPHRPWTIPWLRTAFARMRRPQTGTGWTMQKVMRIRSTTATAASFEGRAA